MMRLPLTGGVERMHTVSLKLNAAAHELHRPHRRGINKFSWKNVFHAKTHSKIVVRFVSAHTSQADENRDLRVNATR